MPQPPARRPQLRPGQQQRRPALLRRVDLAEAIAHGDYTVFRDALKIDKFNLDGECEDFADVYYSVTEAYNLMVSQRDGISQQIKDLEADLYASMRTVPEGQKKPTEKEISAEIRLHPEMQKLREDHNRLVVGLAKLGAMTGALGQRSHMLSNLVTLSVNNYYSQNVGSPRGPARERQLEESREHVLANQPREYPRRAAPQRNR